MPRNWQAEGTPLSPDEGTTVVYLLRHGEVEGGPRFLGATDDPLTRRGWRQMEAAVGTASWNAIISSPLRRCGDFARALSERLGIPIAFDPGLRELNFGRWEGHTAAQLMQTDPEALAKFWDDPYAFPPPAAESLHLFERRALNFWRGIAHTRNSGRRLLVITHGGVIRVILRHVLGLAAAELLRIEVPYASLHRIVLCGEASSMRRPCDSGREDVGGVETEWRE